MEEKQQRDRERERERERERLRVHVNVLSACSITCVFDEIVQGDERVGENARQSAGKVENTELQCIPEAGTVHAFFT